MNPNNLSYVKAENSLSFNRSSFDLSHTHNTTFKSGVLLPVMCEEVLPGDTFTLKDSFVTRLLTPVYPAIDNCYIDVAYFFAPNRILAPWNGDDWEEILGVNKTGYWAQTNPKNVTTFTIQGEIKKGSTLSELGFPIGNFSKGVSGVNLYPLFAYDMIRDHYYRDENTQAPILTVKGHSNYTGKWVNAHSSALNKGCKFHDMFTSCLPSPQKGPGVSLSLGDSAPVYLKAANDLVSTSFYAGSIRDGSGVLNEGRFNAGAGETVISFPNMSGTNKLVGMGSVKGTESNMYADLNEATATTINQLRLAIATQHFFERDARSGTRYNEFLLAHFGVRANPGLIDIPEFLGSYTCPINITQVLQTSSSTSTSPLGATGAVSNTSDSNFVFSKSFVEHGFILGIAIVRPLQSYSQGVPKFFTRSNKFDFYFNEFANIGEQAIYADEIYLDPNVPHDLSNKERRVFGYNEAWCHYKNEVNRVYGALAPNSEQASFIPWTYTNDFSTTPTLNNEFMFQYPSQVGRTLIDQTTDDQFVLNMYHELKVVRELPVFSTPGIDRI